MAAIRNGSARLSRAAAVVLLAVTAMTSASAVPYSVPVAAAATTSDVQLMPQAGSSNYLVYTKLGPPDDSGFRSGDLFVLTKDSATPRRLASVSDETDGAYSLAGPMLVYGSYTQTSSLLGSSLTHYINWFNLNTGESGQVPEDGSTQWVAAAPDGWITLDTSNGALADQPVHGPARPLGRPVPQSTVPFVITGAHELVVYSVSSDDSDGNGELRVMPFDRPGKFRTLIPRLKDAAEEDYRCPGVTEKYVACETEGSRIRLIPLDGSTPVKTTKGCPTFAVRVMHHSAAWQSGCNRRFTVLSPDGKVHVSAHKYAPWMIPAFGELAVSSLGYQHLDLVSGVGKPTVLVSVG